MTDGLTNLLLLSIEIEREKRKLTSIENKIKQNRERIRAILEKHKNQKL